jgi:hypothetical protein
VNGSFEGCPNFGQNIIAPFWSACPYLTDNTPDIYPGPHNIWEMASDGWFYQNLILDKNGKTERISGLIDPPMVPDGCYKVSVDARASALMIHTNWGETRDYTTPAELHVYLKYTYCYSHYRIMEIDTIEKGQPWKTYSAVYSPTDTISTIELRSYFASSPSYYGHVYVDNVRISVSGDTIAKYDIYPTSGQLTKLKLPFDKGMNTIDWLGPEFSCSDCDDITIQVNEPGTYLAYLRDTSSCYYEVYKFNIHCTPESDANRIKLVYPNPGINDVTVFMPCNDLSGDIILCDMNGKIVMRYPFTSNDRSIDLRTDLLHPGTYMIYQEAEGQIRGIKKWLKINPK